MDININHNFRRGLSLNLRKKKLLEGTASNLERISIYLLQLDP